MSKIELPPTAGLPLSYGDFVGPSPGPLTEVLADFLRVAKVGVECSGTACLIVILETLKVRSGRRTVIVPAFTCPLVVLAIQYCGLQTRLCDVWPDSFELCPTALAQALDQDVLAVVPAHLGGRVANLGEVITLARACGASVIEDAAQALGAQYLGRTVGLQGDAAFFSLAAGKGLTLYEGGVWMARDPALHAAIAATSQQLVKSKPLFETWRKLQLLGYGLFYRPQLLRWVYGAPLRRALRRGDLVEAAGDRFDPDIPVHRVSRWRSNVGSRSLARLPTWQAATQRRAKERLPILESLPGVKVLQDAPGGNGTWPLFMLLLPEPQLRDLVLQECWGAGLGIGCMFLRALGGYPELRGIVGDAAYPQADDFASRSLTLSNSLWLDPPAFEQVTTLLQRYLR